MKKLRAIAGILIVFLLGAAAGALVSHEICRKKVEGIFTGEPRSAREFILRRMTRELDLDAAQQEQLRAIVQETHAELRKLRKQFRPQTEAILAGSQERVRAILRPEQREKYEKILAERKKKRENRENAN